LFTPCPRGINAFGFCEVPSAQQIFRRCPSASARRHHFRRLFISTQRPLFPISPSCGSRFQFLAMLPGSASDPIVSTTGAPPPNRSARMTQCSAGRAIAIHRPARIVTASFPMFSQPYPEPFLLTGSTGGRPRNMPFDVRKTPLIAPPRRVAFLARLFPIRPAPSSCLLASIFFVGRHFSGMMADLPASPRISSSPFCTCADGVPSSFQRLGVGSRFNFFSPQAKASAVACRILVDEFTTIGAPLFARPYTSAFEPPSNHGRITRE